METLNAKALLSMLCIFCFITAGSFAQPSWMWAKRAGGIGWEQGSSVCTDQNENVIVTGFYSTPTITFGSITLTCAGTGDAFIVKYSPVGNALWAKSIGGSGYSEGYSVCTDDSGNIILSGGFTGATITIGGITLTNAYAGFDDIFLAKYDSAGNLLWAQAVGGPEEEYGFAVTTDATGNIFLGGYFRSDSLTIGNTVYSNILMGDQFVSKFSSSGTPIWIQAAGYYGDEGTFSMAADPDGYLYAAGTSSANSLLEFGDTTFQPGSGIFLFKYSSSGNPVWGRLFPCMPTFSENSIDVALAPDGTKLYLTGSFNNGTIQIGGTTYTGPVQMENAFLAGLDSTGEVLWVVNPQSSGEGLFGAVTDSYGNIYVKGSFLDSLTLGTFSLTATSQFSSFIAMFKDDGSIPWIQQFGDNGNTMDIAVTDDGNVVVTGQLLGNMQFGATSLAFTGGYDVWVAKLDALTGIETYSFQDLAKVAPNPNSGSFIITGIDFPCELMIYDCLGNLVYNVQADSNSELIQLNVSAGIYILKASGSKGDANLKFLVAQNR